MPRALTPLLHLHARERQRQRDVVLDSHRRDEVERLKDGADALEAVVREVAVRQLAQRQAGSVDVTRGRPVEPAHEREQRALAAARRPDDGHVLTGADVQRDVAQGRHVHLVPAPELA